MKTVIWGYWANNLGDDLFLESLINEFKPTSDNKYYLLTYKKYRQHYKEMGYLPICKDSFLYRAFGKITRRIFKCEPYFFACNKNTLFIMLGGSLFAENKTEIEEQLQYNNLEYAIMHSFKSCIIGSNFGPFRTKDYLEKYRELFSKAGDVCFRDLYSYNIFSNNMNIRFAPDLILAGFWDNIKIKDEDMESNSDIAIAVAPIDLSNRNELSPYKEKYEDVTLKIINYHILNRHKVYLLPFCEQEGDLKVCERLYREAESKEGLVVCQYDRNQIIRTIKNCNTIYSTRFHSMILSIYYNKKCVPLVYDEKVKNAIDCYSIAPEYFIIQDLENIDICNIINSKGIDNTLENLKEEAKEQFRFLYNNERLIISKHE